MRFREVVWAACKRDGIRGKIHAVQAEAFTKELVATVVADPLKTLPPLLGAALELAQKERARKVIAKVVRRAAKKPRRRRS